MERKSKEKPQSKIILILCLIVLFFTLILFLLLKGCNNDIKIEHIDIINLPEQIEIGTFDECNIQLNVIYSDYTTELVDVKEKDIPKEYQHYLYEEGTHSFDYLYKGYEVQFNITMYEVKYTVKFINIEDEVVKEVIVKKNEKVEYPTKEEMYVEGYRFLETYDINITYATSDVEIKGNYVKTWIVKFYNGLNEIISTQIVDDKSSAKSPSEEDIKMDGYTFIKWDKVYTNITSNTDIFGIYEEIKVSCDHDIVKATCTTPSYCIKCNTIFSDALEHQETDWIVDENPTCQKEGTKHTECERCGKNPVQTEKILKSDHNYTTKVVNPTCEEAGYTIYTCSVCKDTYKDTYVDSLGHQETDWIIDEDSTCQKEGTKHTECERCGKNPVQTETISKIDHNYVNNKCTMCGNVETPVPYVENGKTYINFGRYPQTVVSDEELIKELEKITTTNEYGYIEYNGKEYKKQVADPYDSNYTFKNKTKIVDGKTYYFLVEPIKWRVLETANGSYKLLSEYLLDNQLFQTIHGSIWHANNYEYSTIRAWLNGYNGTSYNVEDYTNKGFIDIAFTKEEQELIKTTVVDNSLESTGDKENQYVCNNTNDKIYLLSYQEATNTSYGFSSSSNDSSRDAPPTDYASARYCFMSSNGNGAWWLRSPNGYNYNSARYISDYRFISNFVYDNHYGVRAALEISYKK